MAAGRGGARLEDPASRHTLDASRSRTMPVLVTPPGEDPTPLLGSSPAVEDLREAIAVFARTPFPVLVTGESGTGKSVVAQALHDRSGRRGPSVHAPLTTLPRELERGTPHAAWRASRQLSTEAGQLQLSARLARQELTRCRRSGSEWKTARWSGKRRRCDQARVGRPRRRFRVMPRPTPPTSEPTHSPRTVSSAPLATSTSGSGPRPRTRNGCGRRLRHSGRRSTR